MAIILSGIQPSGSALHLGNYIGAILNWKKIVSNLQPDDKCLFMIADLHTLTSKHNAGEMMENIKNLLATYMACGIVPDDKINFFIQSQIPAHCELSWILSTITPLGQLERMTQFKDKSSKLGREEVNAGLLYYPVLMVADILLYRTNYVPVGEDQTQHLEFTRDIVQKFNNVYKRDDIFVMPKAMIDKTSKRIMSLGDGTKKMSKSTGEDKDRIFLTDSNDQIAKKIKSAKTDSIKGIFSSPERPEVSNLINIFSAISGKTVEDIGNEYSSKDTKTFKEDLAEIVINEISPIREKIAKYSNEMEYIAKIVAKGNETANAAANLTLSKVKKAVGIL